MGVLDGTQDGAVASAGLDHPDDIVLGEGGGSSEAGDNQDHKPQPPKPYGCAAHE